MQFFLANLFAERLAGLDSWVRLPQPDEGEPEEQTSHDDRLTTAGA